MRVLILGAGGMLGHKLYQRLRSGFETFASVRKDLSCYARFKCFDPDFVRSGVDVRRSDDVKRLLDWARPDVVINAVGIIKQLDEANNAICSIEMNSLLPHQLAAASSAVGARFITISTDCVFSGKQGGYTEESPSDAEDLYGRTKFLGEVTQGRALTIRTSMIGRELGTRHGLVEWFMSQKGGKCRGYSRAIFSGLTTIALSDVIAQVITDFPGLNGLYHVATEPISKYDLLHHINASFELGVEIEKDIAFFCDRSLNSDKFRKATGWAPKSWPELVLEMREDSRVYL